MATVRYSHSAGAAGTVNVPVGCLVTSVRAHNTTGGGSLVITPAGGSAQPSIPIPAGANWLQLDFDPSLLELVDGAALTFTGTDAYYVALRQVGGI